MRYIYKVLSLFLIALLAVPVLAQDAETIAIGEEAEGSLTASATEARYTFEGERGQFVIITLVSEDFDAYLLLLDEDGEEIARDDDSAGSLNSRIGPLEIEANGDYTIVASSLGGSAAGDYTLSLQTETLDTIEYGQVLEEELTAAQLSKSYVFRGNEGDMINIRMISDDFDSYLELYDQNDNSYSLITDDDSAGNRNANIGPYTLPADGNYLIIARSYSTNDEGEFTLQFDLVDVVELEIGDSVEAELEADGMLYFSFEGTAGTEINIDVDSGDEIDTTLVLRSPYGYQLTSDDDSGGRLDPAISGYLLGEDGTFTILVSPFSSADSGELTVTLSENELKSVDDESQTLRFSEKQQRDSVTFDAEAGEKVRLTFVVEGDATISPTITLNQGSQSLGYFNFSNVAEASFVTVIPNDGPVIVTTEDYSYTTVQVTVSLERIESEE